MKKKKKKKRRQNKKEKNELKTRMIPSFDDS